MDFRLSAVLRPPRQLESRRGDFDDRTAPAESSRLRSEAPEAAEGLVMVWQVSSVFGRKPVADLPFLIARAGAEASAHGRRDARAESPRRLGGRRGNRSH